MCGYTDCSVSVRLRALMDTNTPRREECWKKKEIKKGEGEERTGENTKRQEMSAATSCFSPFLAWRLIFAHKDICLNLTLVRNSARHVRSHYHYYIVAILITITNIAISITIKSPHTNPSNHPFSPLRIIAVFYQSSPSIPRSSAADPS